MDQVALIGPKDGQSLKWHIEFSKKNNPLVERTFYIHCETEAVAKAIEPFKNQDKLIFIPEGEILNPDICQNKWIYQQLLKLSADKLRDMYDLSELFLFTDVDTIPFRKVEKQDFFHEGEPIFYISSEHEAPISSREFQVPDKKALQNQSFLNWHYGMSWTSWDLLGIEPQHRISAIDACVLWSQKTLRKLKRHLEERSELPWEEAILNSLFKFFCAHRKYFVKKEGFREISFSAQTKVPNEQTVPMADLVQSGRLALCSFCNFCKQK